MHYDLNFKQFYEDVMETWDGWKEKPKSPEIRLGTLGEPTSHPEFIDVLERIRPIEYLTDGRILGTKNDPRRCELMDKTLETKSKVTLLWSDTPYCKKAYRELKESGLDLTIGVRIGKEG